MGIKLNRRVSYDIEIDIPTLSVKQTKLLTEPEINQLYRELDIVHTELKDVLGKVSLEQKKRYTPRSSTTEAMQTVLEYAKTHSMFGVKDIMPVINKADNTTSTILKELYDTHQITLIHKVGTRNVYGPKASDILVDGTNNHDITKRVIDSAKEAQRIRDSH